MKKTLLAVFLILLVSASSYSQVLFSEDFSSNALPAGWSNDSLGMPATHLWDFNNPYGRNITGLFMDADFAIFDSDQGGVDDLFDEDVALTTPIIDISPATSSLYLELDEQLHGVPGIGGSTRMIEYSVDSGATWNMLDSTEDDLGYPNPAYHSVYDISFAVGSASLQVRFHWLGSWDWWWAIDNVKIIAKPACVNPLNPGASASGSAHVCPDEYFFLYLTGGDLASDLIYQWQSSPDSINWTDMIGNTTDLEYVQQPTASYYRASVSCGVQTYYSTPVFVDMSDPVTCYCIGEFSDDCDELNKVIFNTLSNINSGCNGNTNSYINYPDTGTATTSVYADSVYVLTIASGAGTGQHGAACWMDINHDGDFQDADEFYFISDSIPEFSSDFSISILIPATAVGPTRMRVRYVFDNAMSQFSDCDSYSYGETEDYTITILNPSIFVNEISPADFNVYPSPASDVINITSENVKEINAELYDCMSRRTAVQKINGSGQIDVSHLSSGMYMLRLTTSKGSIIKKIQIN